MEKNQKESQVGGSKTIDQATIIYDCIIGSQCYGTQTPESDIDYKKIFIADREELFGLRQFYTQQINITKDDAAFEVGRFLELIANGNPTCLELLYVQDSLVIQTSDAFEYIKQYRDQFITKRSVKAYAGYAEEQLSKAKGKQKFINWDRERTIRKTPIDFCFITTSDGKSQSLAKYLKKNGMKQECCGLVGLSHMHGNYAMYYSETIPYKGIQKDNSNNIRLSSVPKKEIPVGIVSFNLNGYESHCKDYNNYTQFQLNKNLVRYNTNREHGQDYDSKNIMHLKRLSDMGLEISEGKGLILVRPNREELLSIKRGEVNLDDVVKQAQENKKLMMNNLKNSKLPDEVDINFVNNLLIHIRNEFY